MRGSPTSGVGLDDDRTLASLVASLLIAVRSSFLAFVSTVGVGLLVLSVLVSGVVVPSVEYSVVSAMLLIWGVSALIYAVLGRVGLRLIGYS